MDEAKLHQFVGQMLSDLGGAASLGPTWPRIRRGTRPLQHSASERADDGPRTGRGRGGPTSVICANGRAQQANLELSAYDPTT